MNEEYTENSKFELKINESKITHKDKTIKKIKTYQQYSMKLPKKMIRDLRLNKDSKFIIEVIPLKEGQEYPDIKIEVIRDGQK